MAHGIIAIAVGVIAIETYPILMMRCSGNCLTATDLVQVVESKASRRN